MKVALKSTESKKVNIPSKIWKELGWKIGEELEIKVERGLTKDREYFRECIVIERGFIRKTDNSGVK